MSNEPYPSPAFPLDGQTERDLKYLSRFIQSFRRGVSPDFAMKGRSDLESLERMLACILSRLRETNIQLREGNPKIRKVKRREYNALFRALGRNHSIPWWHHESALEYSNRLLLRSEHYEFGSQDFEDFRCLQNQGWKVTVSGIFETYNPAHACCLLLEPPVEAKNAEINLSNRSRR